MVKTTARQRLAFAGHLLASSNLTNANLNQVFVATYASDMQDTFARGAVGLSNKNFVKRGSNGNTTSIGMYIFGGTVALIRTILPIIDYVCYKIAMLLITIAIKTQRAVLNHKIKRRQEIEDEKAALQRQAEEAEATQTLVAAIDKNVKGLVDEFCAKVKDDPAKAVLLHRKFKIELTRQLEYIAQEYDLDLDIPKLVDTIIQQQTKVMQRVVQQAKAKQEHGQKLTKNDLKNSRFLEEVQHSVHASSFVLSSSTATKRIK